MTDARNILAELVACDEESDFRFGLVDRQEMEGGEQSHRLRQSLERARHILAGSGAGEGTVIYRTLFGYEPGTEWHKCSGCRRNFRGGIQAVTCFPCAIHTATAIDAEKGQLREALSDLVDAAHGGGFPHASVKRAQAILQSTEGE